MLTSYDLLLGLALLYERNHQKELAVTGWSGVLVQVVNKQILIEKKDIKEIASVSKATRVIDNRNWLTGLMSYEGTIIPLIELRTVVNAANLSLGLKDRSLLVISQESGTIGLLVDKVLGSRDYWSDDNALSGLKKSNKGCGKVTFSYQGSLVEVCNIEKLATMMGLRREVVNTVV